MTENAEHQESPAMSEMKIAEMEQTIEIAQQKLVAFHEIQKGLRMQLILSVGVIVVMMLVFMLNTGSAIRSNFETSKVMAVFNERRPALTRQLQAAFMPLLKEVAISYKTMAAERFQKLAPKLRNQAEKDFEQLEFRLRNHLLKQINTAVNRVNKRVLSRVREVFPHLADERSPEMAAHFTVALDKQTQRFVKIVTDIFNQELTRYSQILGNADDSKYTALSDSELDVELMHEIVMLLDFHVQAMR